MKQSTARVDVVAMSSSAGVTGAGTVGISGEDENAGVSILKTGENFQVILSTVQF